MRVIAQTVFLFQAAHEAGSSVGMHQHGCCELVYYASGSGTTRIHDVAYRYGPGSFAVIRPGTPHDEKRAADTSVVCVGFQLPDRQLPAPQEGLYQDAPERPLGRRLEGMLDELAGKRAHYALQLDLELSSLLIQLVRKQRDPAAAVADSGHWLAFALHYIDEHYREPIRLEQLAAMSGYSYHHFRHCFKQRFAVPPLAYVLGKRLDEARRLLLHADLSVLEIALHCGFSSDAQLCAMFKRRFGMTPGQFRRSV
ncbi:Transcriptional regulator, AraC family [Paenibacillus pasadenensis]|uniref:Transcriptional regulator, AraC family n=1 Tax=Paenibacillus pasadenensis TaxID=217090 RepID=A0A2N5MZX7_9BACL|nr:Transcriptional regulator, AraC family [Paenibacillus pasadenensis]QGG54276.1 helix-turn-helix domain-containing protein [Paenibacillus sp. B01]